MTLGFAMLWAARAFAHPAPAEAPLFGRTDCIEVVDKREVAALEIAYRVAVDDTTLVMGDIDLPDAKTHQFFAFAASVLPSGFDYDAYAFDADTPKVRLPPWITVDDVKRAAMASGALDATGFSTSDVPEGAVLEAIPEIEGQYLRITGDGARVPITQAQALKGVSWPLADVPAGVYAIAGYIFSPPYNGWAVRATPVKIVDGEVDVPAIALEPTRASLFAYQGLRVQGCLDVPEGTVLQSDFAIEERPEIGHVPWLDAREVRSGAFVECFHNPAPELSGSLRLRVRLTAKDGSQRTYYAPDTITALPGDGTCSEAGNVCCDFPGAMTDAPSPGCDAGRGGGCRELAAGDAGSAPDGSEASDSGGGPAAGHRADEAPAPGARGCGVSRGPFPPHAALWLCCLYVLLARLRRRRAWSPIIAVD